MRALRRPETWLALVGFVLCFLACSALACDIPSKSDVRESCGEYVDMALAKVDDVLAECRAQADEAEAVCRAEIDGVVVELMAWVDELLDDARVEFEERLASAEVEVYARAGCVRDLATLAWDCSGSPLCR